MLILKRLIFFLFKNIWRISTIIAKKILRIPLIALYSIHFKLKSRFANSGLTIKSPLLYIPFSGQSLGYLFIFGLGIVLIWVNFFLKTADIDPLNPKNIMTQYIQQADDVVTEEGDAGPPSGSAYAPFTGLKPSLPSEEKQEDVTSGDIANLSDSLIKPILPSSEERIAEPNKLHSYIVQEGDTLGSIAKKFGIKAQTVLWANQLTENSLLQIGQKIVILPLDGMLYKIHQGDTLGKIAQRYSLDIDSIITANKLAGLDTTLSLGQIVLLPNAVRPEILESIQPQKKKQTLLARIKDIFVPSQKPTGQKSRAIGGRSGFIWPTSASHVTQYFSWRHPGVDIAGPQSNDIYAAAGGTVIFSGWQRGYGNTILIDHGDGHKTRYGHASKLFVSAGEEVTRGEVIAKVGSTGRSTGPHLHFEIWSGKSRINPLGLIR